LCLPLLVQVHVNYGKAAAHNDKAEKADTGSVLSLEKVGWPTSMERGDGLEQEHGSKQEDHEQPAPLQWPGKDTTQPILLDNPEGASIEDEHGTLLALWLPGALLGISVSLICILNNLHILQPITRIS